MSGNLVLFPSGKRTLVLDSWPVIEWLKAREPSAAAFDLLLQDGRQNKIRLVMSTLNLGEVYYNCIQRLGEATAADILDRMRKLPIEILHITGEDVLRAARLKGLYPIAYGDTFAALLAADLDAPVVTGDPDFRKLENAGLIEVLWLGK